MAQLLSSRMVWQESVREAAEDARKQADLIDEARKRGLTAEGEPFGASYDLTVRGDAEQIVSLAKWAREREVEINEVLVGNDEDLEMVQRELGKDVGVASF